MSPFVIRGKGNQLFINDKEITNPVAKWAIIVAASLIGGLIAVGVIFLVLPIIGIVLTLSFAILSIILVALGIGFLVLIWLFVF
jgi:hypothetical protein